MARPKKVVTTKKSTKKVVTPTTGIFDGFLTDTLLDSVITLLVQKIKDFAESGQLEKILKDLLKKKKKK